jgi:hypothetical protein
MARYHCLIPLAGEKYCFEFLRTDIIYMELPNPEECLARYASKSFVTDGSLTNIHILRICQARLGPGAHSTNPNVSGFTIQIATHAVLHDTALGLDPALQSLRLPHKFFLDPSFYSQVCVT